jgi:hypothetical protein
MPMIMITTAIPAIQPVDRVFIQVLFLFSEENQQTLMIVVFDSQVIQYHA